MRDQRQWSVKECSDILGQCLDTLKQDLAAQGDGGMLVWDKVSCLVELMNEMNEICNAH